MGPTILFTHLKIILLQCFQFSVFNNNKLNPNGPLEWVSVWVGVIGDLEFLIAMVSWSVVIELNRQRFELQRRRLSSMVAVVCVFLVGFWRWWGMQRVVGDLEWVSLFYLFIYFDRNGLWLKLKCFVALGFLLVCWVLKLGL